MGPASPLIMATGTNGASLTKIQVLEAVDVVAAAKGRTPCLIAELFSPVYDAMRGPFAQTRYGVGHKPTRSYYRVC